MRMRHIVRETTRGALLILVSWTFFRRRPCHKACAAPADDQIDPRDRHPLNLKGKRRTHLRLSDHLSDHQRPNPLRPPLSFPTIVCRAHHGPFNSFAAARGPPPRGPPRPPADAVRCNSCFACCLAGFNTLITGSTTGASTPSRQKKIGKIVPPVQFSRSTLGFKEQKIVKFDRPPPLAPQGGRLAASAHSMSQCGQFRQLCANHVFVLSRGPSLSQLIRTNPGPSLILR